MDDVDTEDEDAEATTKSSVAMTVKKRGGDSAPQQVDKDDKMVSEFLSFSNLSVFRFLMFWTL